MLAQIGGQGEAVTPLVPDFPQEGKGGRIERQQQRNPAADLVPSLLADVMLDESKQGRPVLGISIQQILQKPPGGGRLLQRVQGLGEFKIGKKKASIVDTWWQTETGGFLCSTLPGVHKMKPGSAGPAVPGIYPIIFDDDGKPLPAGSGKAGNICIQNPWPGRMLTIWGDDDRFVKQYYQRYNNDPKSKDWHDWPYFAGDGAVQAADGYYRILGRIDDVINVAGHRLGTKELESAALMVSEIGEAAVVPVADPVKGKIPHIFVSLKPGIEASAEIQKKVTDTLAREIGPIAKPGKVWIVPDMPKTRSGKIMRRVLSAIANKQDVGDITTLANPQVVEEIQKMA